MNGKNLLDRMSDVDPKLIADAEKKPLKKRGLFIGITSGMATVAAAAAVALAVGTKPVEKPPVISGTTDIPGSSVVDSSSTSSTSSTNSDTWDILTSDPFADYAELPKISSGDYSTRGGSSVVNIGLCVLRRSLKLSEFERHSPWSEEAEPKTLPVYISSSAEPDIEQMRDYVKTAAAALGIAEDELEFTDNSSDGENESYRQLLEDMGIPEDEIERELTRVRRISMSMTTVSGKADGVSFYLSSNYTLDVEFDDPIKLPDGCRLGSGATESEDIAAVNYLADKFKDLLGYEKPLIARCGDFDEYNYGVYESAGNLETQIVNYSIKHADFIENFDDTTEMKKVRIYSAENCEKFGDYPLLTAQLAEGILRSEITPDEYRLPEEATIVKTDIVYDNIAGFTAVIPYYEFYVEVDETPNPGYDAVYDIYRIAAIPEQFIDMENEDYSVRA